jgi:hypothetical protein
MNNMQAQSYSVLAAGSIPAFYRPSQCKLWANDLFVQLTCMISTAGMNFVETPG